MNVKKKKKHDRKREAKNKDGWEVRDEIELKREERKKLIEDEEDFFPQKRKGI